MNHSPARYPVTFGVVMSLLAFSVMVAAACVPQERRVPTAPTVPPVIVAPIAPVPLLPVVLTDASSPVPTRHPPPIQLRFRGTNLSGAEFGANVPGTLGRDYGWPGPADVDYFMARGMTHFRIPIRHERLQRETKSALDEDYWKGLKALVDYATGAGATVAIEPHNSFRYGVGCDTSAKADPKCRIVTETEIGDFWGRVAARLKDNARVQINVTNEPHDMPTEQVVALNNAALKEIRRVGFRGLVLVPGNGWAGGAHWDAKWYGTPNAIAMLKVVDPADNMAFEVHQYADDLAAGAHVDCISPTIIVERLTPFVAWLRAHGRRGWLGEIAAIDTPKCREAITNGLAFVEADYDIWVGWDWWSAGPRWKSSKYPLSLSPFDDGLERPQLAWLKPFLACRPSP